MQLSEEKKIDILMMQLGERYTALHQMRDRSMTFTLWLLGLGLGMAWLLMCEVTLDAVQILFTILLLCVLAASSILFLRGIQRGFSKNREIVIGLETALSLYDNDAYGLAAPVLPKEFSSSKCRWSGHFETLYALLATMFLILIVLTLANPCRRTKVSDPNSRPAPTEGRLIQQQ